jgi:plasmid maintenance system antidote protein VapI
MAKKKTKPSTVTETVRDTIVARSLTAYRVSQTIGTRPHVVQRFLNRERDLRGATLDKIAEALGLALIETETGHPDLKGGDNGESD